MPLGPVFRHEMLAAGRKKRYFLGAALVGAAMLALLAIGYATVSESNRYRYNGDTTFEDGRLSISGVAYLTSMFYSQFAWATMAGVLAVTPAVAAGAIAMERERRTIEYLFATDLSNSEIVIDKLLARLLVVAKLVLAALPVLAIFRLLGGVPGSLLLVHFAMLASTATLVAAIALTVGVWCDRARDAVPRAIGAVFIWLIAWPVLWTTSSFIGQYATSAWADWLLTIIDPMISFLGITHPLVMLGTAAGVSGGTLGVDLDLEAIGWMVGSQLAAAFFLLGLSVVMVRRVHLRAASSPGVRVKQVKNAPSSRSPYEYRPMLWKEMFAASVAKKGSRWAKRIGVLLLVLIVALPLVTTLWNASIRGGTGWASPIMQYMQTAVMMSTTCGSIVLLLIGARAAGLVTHERERETWLTLLTTPMSSTEILAAKMLGNLYAFFWPLVGVVMIPLLGVLLDWSAVLATLGTLLTLASVGWAATAIGLAFSLRMKSSIKAVGATTLVLLSVGLFYSFMAMAFFAIAGGSEESFAVFVFPPLVPMLIAMPSILAVDGFGGGDEWMMPSYIAGIIFYTAVGIVVSTNNAQAFDRICQRGVGKWAAQPSTPTAGRYPDTGPLPPETA